MLFDLSPYLPLNAFIALWLAAMLFALITFDKKDN